MKTLLPAFAIMLTLASCAQPAEQARSAVKADAPVYVDVRTTQEYATGHVAGALNIPVEALAQRWPELEGYRARQLIVYCRSGRRSAAAIEILKAQGFEKLENGGAFEALAAAGVPVAKEQ